MEIRASDCPVGPPAGPRMFWNLRSGRLLAGLRSRTLPAWTEEFAVNGSLFGTIPARLRQFKLPYAKNRVAEPGYNSG